MITADLHIHTCLSPCGSLEMSPAAIIEAAVSAALSMIAVCDHNAAANCAAITRLGAAQGITVISGMEVTTAEEAHVLAYFASSAAAEDFARFIYDHLPSVMNNADRMGDQVIVDERGNIAGELDKYLGMATDLSVDRLVDEAHSRGALVVPSHIDRPYAGIIAQLGFLPDLPFDGVEVAFERNLTAAGTFTVLASSDSHMLHLVGTKKSILNNPEEASFAALGSALSTGSVSPVYG